MIKSFNYFGGKGSKLKLLMPYLSAKVETYAEPCCGSCAVLIARPVCKVELANDVDNALVRYWREMQRNPDDVIDWCANKILHHEDELRLAHDYRNGVRQEASEAEFAAYYLASIFQSFCAKHKPHFAVRYCGSSTAMRLQNFAKAYLPAIHKRIKRVQFTNKGVLRFLRNFDKRLAAKAKTLIYLDPPYLLDNETNRDAYLGGGMSADEHAEMLDIVLSMCKRKPDLRVAISGYASPLYDKTLARFVRKEFTTTCTVGNPDDRQQCDVGRVETLWMNYGKGRELI